MKAKAYKSILTKKKRHHRKRNTSTGVLENKTNIAPNYNAFKEMGEHLFSSVTYLEKESLFYCIFQNGDSFSYPRKFLPEDQSKSKVRKVTLTVWRDCFKVFLQSGKKIYVPCCLVRHHCDSSYEYYKHSKKSIEAEKRAKKVGLRVKRIRLERGWTQAELAKKTKIKRENISRMESCKHSPSLDTLEKIADAFKIPLANLVADPGAKS